MQTWWLDIEAIGGGNNSDTSDNSGAAIGNPYLGKTFAKGLKEKAPSTKNRLSELKIIMVFCCNALRTHDVELLIQ